MGRETCLIHCSFKLVRLHSVSCRLMKKINIEHRTERNRNSRREIYKSASLSTTNTTWTGMGSQPGLQCKRIYEEKNKECMDMAYVNTLMCHGIS